jgi:hypothetical protein
VYSNLLRPFAMNWLRCHRLECRLNEAEPKPSAVDPMAARRHFYRRILGARVSLADVE